MKLKNIPSGNYTKISAVYVPLIESYGTCCENCGRLIANIVTVKNEDTNTQYMIGQDCAKTLFSSEINNEIDRDIKSQIAIKKRIEADKQRAEKALVLQKRLEILSEFNNACREAGIVNDNCNEIWAKQKHDEILTVFETRYNTYVSRKRAS